MIHQSDLPGKRSMGPVIALALAAALLLICPVSAVAPPVKAPEIPGPPLFGAEDIHTDPVHMAMAVIGATTSPTPAWAAAATISFGEHRLVQAWKLEGPMTNKFNRITSGVAAVFLNGFQGNLPGVGAVVQLATLKTADYLECWALRDTDRFFKLPEAWLPTLTDGRGFPVGGLEAETYSKILALANYTSAAAFKRAARRDITYTHVFNEPDSYRGKVIHIEGKLKRINRFNPPEEASKAGVNDLYEAWVFPEYLGTNPYCVIFTEWPADLPRSLLGKPKIPEEYVVGIDGYFIKKFRYQANDGRNTQRDAPLVMGHTLLYTAHPQPVPVGRSWLSPVATSIVVVFATLFCTVIGLTYWFRRTDNRVRKRLLAAHSPEFVLPTPDALPVATPLAPPVKRAHSDKTTLPSRITFIAGSGDRRGEPPSGEGEKRGSGDTPPEEGAGA